MSVTMVPTFRKTVRPCKKYQAGRCTMGDQCKYVAPAQEAALACVRLLTAFVCTPQILPPGCRHASPRKGRHCCCCGAHDHRGDPSRCPGDPQQCHLHALYSRFLLLGLVLPIRACPRWLEVCWAARCREEASVPVLCRRHVHSWRRLHVCPRRTGKRCCLYARDARCERSRDSYCCCCGGDAGRWIEQASVHLLRCWHVHSWRAVSVLP